jgi:hypothetical protein
MPNTIFFKNTRHAIILYFLAQLTFIIFPNHSRSFFYCFSDSISFSDSLNDTPRTTHGIESNHPDSNTLAIYRQYINWTEKINDCLLLSELAATEGYKANLENISSRIKVYSEAFPGVLLNKQAIINELTIENYFRDKINLLPQPNHVENTYKEYLQKTPLASPPGLNAIYDILVSHIIFSSDSLQHICYKLSEQRVRKNIENRNNFLKPWPLNKIRLKLNPNLCVAKDQNKCIITVERFNAFLSICPVRQSLQLDSARKQVLVDFLNSAYISNMSSGDTLLNNDSLMQEREAHFEKVLISNKTRFYDKISDPELYKRTYEKYFQRFFAEKSIKTIGIIGSSDSLYIDSIYHVISDYGKHPSSNSSNKIRFLKSLPWHQVSSQILPDTLITLLDTQHIQDISFLKTHFGFFLCRMINRKRKKEISFNEAGNILTYLIHEEKLRSQGKPDSVCMLEYYNQHKKQFVSPDTIIAQQWIVPYRDSIDFYSLDAQKQKACIIVDTSSFVPLNISSCDLPPEIRVKLYNNIETDKNFIGPLFCSIGTFYFLIHEIKKGGQLIPYNTVKENIKNNLMVQNLPFDSLFNTEIGAQLKEQQVFAKAYQLEMLQNFEKASDEDVLKWVKKEKKNTNGIVDTTIISKNLNLYRRKFIMHKTEQAQKNINEWISSLDINYSVLFSGALK